VEQVVLAAAEALGIQHGEPQAGGVDILVVEVVNITPVQEIIEVVEQVLLMMV
jgi:hypothetical protein